MTWPDAAEPSPGELPRRLRGADAFRLHLTLTLGLALCAGAFSIEVVRALDGNKLSWLYVFEWPLFGGFGIYMWWNLLTGRDRRHPSDARDPADDHHDLDTLRSARKVGRVAAQRAAQRSEQHNERHNERLEAWQNYVREINETESQAVDERPYKAT